MRTTVINYATRATIIGDAIHQLRDATATFVESLDQPSGIAWDVCLTFGKYDLSLLITEPGTQAIRDLERSDLFLDHEHFQFKTAIGFSEGASGVARIAKPTLGFLDDTGSLPYLGISSVNVNRAVFQAGRRALTGLIRAIERSASRFVEASYLGFSLGYEDLLLVLASSSIKRIKQAIYAVRSLDCVDVFYPEIKTDPDADVLRSCVGRKLFDRCYAGSDNGYVLRGNWEVGSSRAELSRSLRNCGVVSFCHATTGTSTNIGIRAHWLLDSSWSPSSPHDRRLQAITRFRLVPGHFDNQVKRLTMSNGRRRSRRPMHGTSGAFDLMLTSRSFSRYVKAFRPLLFDALYQERSPVRSQETTILIDLPSRNMESGPECEIAGWRPPRRGSADDQPLDLRSKFPAHVAQHINNIVTAMTRVAVSRTSEVLLSSLQAYLPALRYRLYDMREPVDPNDVELWLEHISDFLLERYLGAQSLLDAGELHSVLYKGSYIKVLFVLDQLGNALLDLYSSVFGKPEQSHHILTMLGDKYGIVVHHDVEFLCHFVEVPFHYQYEPRLLSTFAHECFHVFEAIEGWSAEEWIRIATPKTHLISNYDHAEARGVGEYERRVYAAQVYLESLADLVQVVVAHSGRVEEYVEVLLQIVADCRLIDDTVFARIILVYTWYIGISWKGTIPIDRRQFSDAVTKTIDKHVIKRIIKDKAMYERLEGVFSVTPQGLTGALDNAIENLERFIDGFLHPRTEFHRMIRTKLSQFEGFADGRRDTQLVSLFRAMVRRGDSIGILGYSSLWWACVRNLYSDDGQSKKAST